MIEFLLIISIILSGANAGAKVAKPKIKKPAIKRSFSICKEKMSGKSSHDVRLKRVQAILKCAK